MEMYQTVIARQGYEYKALDVYVLLRNLSPNYQQSNYDFLLWISNLYPQLSWKLWTVYVIFYITHWIMSYIDIGSTYIFKRIIITKVLIIYYHDTFSQVAFFISRIMIAWSIARPKSRLTQSTCMQTLGSFDRSPLLLVDGAYIKDVLNVSYGCKHFLPGTKTSLWHIQQKALGYYYDWHTSMK